MRKSSGFSRTRRVALSISSINCSPSLGACASYQAAASTTSSTACGRKITIIASSDAAKLQLSVDLRGCQSLDCDENRRVAHRGLLSPQACGPHPQLRSRGAPTPVVPRMTAWESRREFQSDSSLHHLILSNVFWRISRSLALPVFSRLVSIHFFSNKFFVGRSVS